MKRLKTLLAFLLIAVLLASSGLSAAADEGAADAPDWDETMRALLDSHNANDTQVAAGYLNLVTGEEHYLNADAYMAAASMFKLPLCMYYTALLQNGGAVWDEQAENMSYKYVQDRILLDSSNEAAQILWEKLGGFENFRKLTAPYLGVDPDEVTPEIVQYNRYTPRQFITCLKLLYSEREFFHDILEDMKQATPGRYFRFGESRYEIAHKFGYVPATLNGEDNLTNDCGIVFCPQPIALVFFTRNVGQAEELLGAYCTAMIDYTAATEAAEEAAREAAQEAVAETPAPSAETAAPAEGGALSQFLPADVAGAAQGLPLVPLGFVLLFTLLGIVAIIRFSVRYKARFLTLLLSLLLSAAAMLLAITGLYAGTVYAKPSGDPSETVTRFFDALCAGRYEAACEQLRDYADLGLGDTPSTAAGRQVYDALHKSYAYELAGEPESRMLDASQKVRFRYLRLPAIEEEVAAETQRQIAAIVESRSTSEVYDEDRHYLPAVTEEAYLAALDAVLAHAEDYYDVSELTVALTYTDARWQMLMSPELLRALSGGTGV